MLHSNQLEFKQIVLKASEYFNIKPAIIEKDYFVTQFLKKIVKKQPDIIFKGGTSLSKCYKIIDRFSEDIDLNIAGETKPGESKRRHLKANIVSTVDEFGFTLTNSESIQSRRDFNKYIIDYPSVFESDFLKQNLILETAVFFRAYPYKTMEADSFIYRFLKEKDFESIINEYDLEPFKLNVQTADRTFIDKLFALGDYYLGDSVTTHSRHIYDLYKLAEIVEINDNLRALTENVKKERQPHKTCLSAQNDIEMNVLLNEIIDKEIYKADYENITTALLFKEVGYAEAITVLKKVVEDKLF